MNMNFEQAPDNINPDHYKKGGIETFDYMGAKMTPDQMEGYLFGNILKYVSRYQFKNGVEDLKKAEWYLEKLIELKG
ncbi:DUF3310 domain-containing protein [Metabacillus dongyingensis]|uniref:DUF3310 domain-containing protein n=1 Tax=Metabacillus dongyingensis TaxID=2874282 RepID=UPI003B8B3458